MAKKNLQAAAAGTLADMNQTPAQRMAQQAQEAPETAQAKNDKPFTVWTTADNVRRWKAYQKAKRDTVPTQAALVEMAIREYMQAHPVTEEEKEELLKSLEL